MVYKFTTCTIYSSFPKKLLRMTLKIIICTGFKGYTTFGGVFMRLIARFLDQRQASALIDSLRNVGLDRKDMIVSSLAKEQEFHNIKAAAENMIFIKSEREGLGELVTFTEGITELKGKEGIIVAVETTKHNTSRIREIMEQSGAVEIVQD